jgi:hypothetical protein
VSLKLVQAGNGEPRNCALFFLVDATIMGAKLKAALGADTCIVTDVDAHGGESYETLRSHARALGNFSEVAGMALVGYSMGGQRVRGLLAAGADPSAVVIIDGTHDTLPPTHLEVWRSYGAKARARTRMFVGTCTQQVYVESLPANQRFMATRHVLEQAFSLALPPNTEADDGDLHCLSYPSASIDAPAHIAQAQVTMPDMCSRYLAPWLKGWLKPQRPSQTPPLPNTHVTNEALTPLGERCVLWCENEFACAVREDPPGSNTSPRIRDYLAPCMRNGKLLGLRAAAWCAAAQCCAMRDCLAPGEAEPHPYRCSGIELETDAQKLGTWRGPKYTPRRGDIAVLMRTNSDPSKGSWERHVVRVRSVDGDHMTTIAGNEGNGWAVSAMRLDDARILCFIEYPQ